MGEYHNNGAEAAYTGPKWESQGFWARLIDRFFGETVQEPVNETLIREHPAFVAHIVAREATAQPMALVEVRWIDSVGDHGWIHRKELEPPEPHTCWSIGWLIAEGPNAIMLANTYGPEAGTTPEQFSGTMTIPRAAITSYRELRAPAIA